MSVLVNVILGVQMLTALGMIGLILVQHGKGADMGAAFGSGSSGSLFGASGSANFLSRTTGVLATVFFVATLALAYFGNARPTGSGSVPCPRQRRWPSSPRSASRHARVAGGWRGWRRCRRVPASRCPSGSGRSGRRWPVRPPGHRFRPRRCSVPDSRRAVRAPLRG